MKFKSRYGVTGVKEGITFTQPSTTMQSFKDDADINCIISRFETTGVLVDPTVPVSRVPQFGDFSELPTFQESQNVIVVATNAFNALPAKIRERFGNNPATYFDFVQGLEKGSDVYDEAVRLGIVNEPVNGSNEVPARPAESAGQEVKS